MTGKFYDFLATFNAFIVIIGLIGLIFGPVMKVLIKAFFRSFKDD